MSIVATDVTEPQLLRIPETLLVDAKIRTEVEQFLYFEALLLDERQYGDWYRLLADDIHYFMPSRMNRLMHETDKENTTEKQHGLFDDNKRSIGWRVEQILTRKHWSEDPPSRSKSLGNRGRYLGRRAARRAAPVRDLGVAGCTPHHHS
jgi:hypothetical protein